MAKPVDARDLEADKVKASGERLTAFATPTSVFALWWGDIYQIAKNCRTSVEMIQKYYASHIKTSPDASAINVRKSKMAPILKDRPTPKETPKKRGRRPEGDPR